MIRFVLDHAGVKALGLPLDDFPLRVESAIADSAVAGYQTTKARQAETSFPAGLHPTVQRLDLGVDQCGDGDGRCIGIASALFRAENNDPLAHPDLRRGKPHSTCCLHDLEHFIQQ